MDSSSSVWVTTGGLAEHLDVLNRGVRVAFDTYADDAEWVTTGVLAKHLDSP